MKCFRILIFFYLISVTHAANYEINAQGNSSVKTGDIVELQIKNLDGGEIPYLKGKRVAKIFYVMDQDGEYLKAIVADPEKKEDSEPEKDTYVLKGINYSPKSDAPLKDYLLQDVDYSFGSNYNWFFYLLISLVIIFARPTFRRIQKNRLQKSLEIQRQTWLQSIYELVIKAQSRSEIERIYKEKAVLEACFEYNKKAFQNFFSFLESIQYKKDWNEDELSHCKTLLSVFKKDLKVARGI